MSYCIFDPKSLKGLWVGLLVRYLPAVISAEQEKEMVCQEQNGKDKPLKDSPLIVSAVRDPTWVSNLWLHKCSASVGCFVEREE